MGRYKSAGNNLGAEGGSIVRWNWKIALELCGIVLAALLKLCVPQDDDHD